MNYYTDSPPEQAAPSSHGCLFLFVLPPLAVILMGFLAFGQVSIAETAPLLAPTPTVISAQEAKDERLKTASKEQDDEKQETPEAKDPPSGELARLFTPEVLYWEDKILKWSEKYGLDPNLVATVMQIESCGDPQARSGAGAMGLFRGDALSLCGGRECLPAGDQRPAGARLFAAGSAKGRERTHGFCGI